MWGAQVELVKPLGIRFARGSDGGAYVTRSDPNLGNTDKMVQVCSLLSKGAGKMFFFPTSKEMKIWLKTNTHVTSNQVKILEYQRKKTTKTGYTKQTKICFILLITKANSFATQQPAISETATASIMYV